MKLLLTLSLLVLIGCGQGTATITQMPFTNIITCDAEILGDNTRALYSYGDSTTEGISGTDCIQSWPSTVGHALNITVRDLALGGTSLFFTNNYEWLMSQTHQPGSIVTFMIGINDASQFGTDPAYLATFQQGISDIINHMATEDVKFYILTPLKMMPGASPDDSVVQLYANAIVAAYNANPQSNVKLIDLHSWWQPTTQTNANLVHPNAYGYTLIGNYVLQNL
jgi:lysophospholipase L1-like esterase